jgi:hypothetical protein
MTALTADRTTLARDGKDRCLPVAANVTIYCGALVMLNVAGTVQPASATVGMIAVGVAQEAAHNAQGTAGAITVPVRRGAFCFQNSTGGDAITAAAIGQQCYAVDDQTVALTNGSNSRSVAGHVFDVTVDGVWVDIQ